MYIKKFFLALPVALLAVFFTFCAKEQQAPIAELPTNDGIVGERQCCAITVTVNNGGSVALCGVQTTQTVCNTLGATVLRGTDQWAGAAGTSRNYNLCFPNNTNGTIFQVASLVAGPQVSVTVTSAVNAVTFNVGGGLPIQKVGVGSNCGVILL